MDRGELDDHTGAPWIVECVCQLVVSVAQEAKDIQVAVMMAPRLTPDKSIEFCKNALAESFESKPPYFTEDLPV